MKSKGGDTERLDEVLHLLTVLNSDEYKDKEIFIMGDFNGEKDTFEDLFINKKEKNNDENLYIRYKIEGMKILENYFKDDEKKELEEKIEISKNEIEV